MRISALRWSTLATALLVCATSANGQNAVPIPAPLNPANINSSVAACTDFYEYANGGWIAKNPIPPAYSSWGSFQELTERNNLVLKNVIENAARQAPTTTDPNTRKLGTFYTSCMDSTAAETAAITPLAGELGRVAAITNRDQLLAEISHLHAAGFGAGFAFLADNDAKNASMIIAELFQAGISLPDRDYYLVDNPRMQGIRARYGDYVTNLFKLAGDAPDVAAANAQRVLSLETALAKGSLPRVALRDPNALYHMMTISEANALTPAVNWGNYLRDIGLGNVTTINVATPDFFKALNTEIEQRPLDDWKAYLRWNIISRSAGVLSSAFVNENFKFGSLLTGAKEQQPRWKRCLQLSDQTLGDALGKEYVKVVFTPDAKAKMLSMVQNLRSVLRDRIQHADWMSEDTRKQALVKMDAFTQKIGYPDTWRDYAPLNVSSGAFINNVVSARAYSAKRQRDKIGKPVDRAEWGMTAPTVNAYYNPSLNEIVFPAGRLQPPFFALSYDDAANYGGVGGTIGHEMSHGFDDEGRQFDAQGNLRDWWTAEDAKRYSERAKVVETQYNGYVAIDSTHLNGKLTLGENLADVVGVSIAYEAMERAIKGKDRKPINGFTPEQRFFLAYAQARMGVDRPERARVLVATDPHSPGRFRVNGPLSNMTEFAKAFGCKEGDPMVRPESMRARIW
ncbi:MAG TPA: M13 family metallopeptidase [Gemmatimonadaceae bacterium]|nr:M13 family metallopeptidase [Gemmatimonadaceae bacterium]